MATAYATVNSDVIIQVLNKIPGRQAVKIPQKVHEEVSVATLDGIRSFHQFWFDKQEFEVRANTLSSFDEQHNFSEPPTEKSFCYNLADYCRVSFVAQ